MPPMNISTRISKEFLLNQRGPNKNLLRTLFSFAHDAIKSSQGNSWVFLRVFRIPQINVKRR